MPHLTQPLQSSARRVRAYLLEQPVHVIDLCHSVLHQGRRVRNPRGNFRGRWKKAGRLRGCTLTESVSELSFPSADFRTPRAHWNKIALTRSSSSTLDYSEKAFWTALIITIACEPLRLRLAFACECKPSAQRQQHQSDFSKGAAFLAHSLL